ncbi:uncharacterized protein BT62DRAFT_195819 [Guyanagaster necrorhizus]|uniref:Uncharacterized protein n=1 Tax=Guyanagaster necrorhizus TaxID=856835 RepID=A0A9P8AKU7_9AGAR|nr:uncharacterized protein BT62DRAFT_195819 [Guyanagaster necrorhizus MCA 3950]KAG7439039.1 hypothetical protein BT62DRAFT_195819 [Guyanagaster necrorhizus MCA 3950]
METLILGVDDAGWGRTYGKTVVDVVRQRLNEKRAAELNVTKLFYLRIDCVGDEVIHQLRSDGLDALEDEGLYWGKGESPYLEVEEYWVGTWYR